MEEERKAMEPYLAVLKDLAEGRTEPAAWLAWWSEHAETLKAICLPGWLTRLTPLHDRKSIIRAVLRSHEGACYILHALNVPFQESDHYFQMWQAEFAAFCAAEKARKKEQAQALKPVVAVLRPEFPKFTRFLQKHAEEIGSLQPGLSEADLDELEQELNLCLPQTYRRFLRGVSELQMEGLEFGGQHPFLFEGRLYIADYFLEADGDGVLLETGTTRREDAPVWYYAHAEQGKVKPLAKGFKPWLESLAKSPLFQDAGS